MHLWRSPIFWITITWKSWQSETRVNPMSRLSLKSWVSSLLNFSFLSVPYKSALLILLRKKKCLLEMVRVHALSNSNSIRNARTRFNDEFPYTEFVQDMAYEEDWLLNGNVYSMLPSIRPLQFNIAITLLSWSQEFWNLAQRQSF